MINCPICKTISVIYPLKVDVNLYRCPNCNHCFTDISVLNEMESYDENYFIVRHPNWFKNPNIKLFHYISNALQNLPSGAKVLDVGCGKGDLLRYLHHNNIGLDLTGIDLTSNLPVSGIKFISGDVFELTEKNKFHVLLSLAVIEHIDDVTKFIKKLDKLIFDNGLIILMTIDESSLLYSISKILGKFGYWEPANRLFERHHINHFNRSSLKQFMLLNGFEVIEIKDHVMPIAAVDFDKSNFIKEIILKFGVALVFFFAKLIHRSHTQTVVCKKLQR